jgi:TonB-dependent starch-binding outer membrane protein SusC
MKWSYAIIATLVVGCAHGGASRTEPASPPPPPPPPPAPLPTPSGSIARSDDPARENSTTIEQLLAGRIAGVIVSRAPGGGITVRMQGPTSFYSGQQPLIVVDGQPVDGGPNGTLTWLDPQEIESIQALKDPSQTAIWGVRGANGVILIKTKGSH